MKKTFKLTHPKTKYARLVDSVRSEIKRYLKRERGKAIPEGFFWDFDCRFGPSAEQAKVLDVSEIGKAINEAEAELLEAFYVEILAKQVDKAQQSYVKAAKVIQEEAEEQTEEEAKGESSDPAE